MISTAMSHRSLKLAFITLLGTCALPALPAVAAESGRIISPDVQRRLAGGEVVVEAATDADPERPRGRVRAAVLIRAKPEAIWAVITDCREALKFVPGLRLCRRIDGAPDGRWANIEQEINYSWYLPTVHNVLRADCDPPRRIDFHRVSGDLKQEEGTWLLTPASGGSATVVEYEMYLDPGFWIPRWLVSRTLRQDVPGALAGLRERVEHPR